MPFTLDTTKKFLIGEDFHFHYFPHLHEGYINIKNRVVKPSMILIHDNQYSMDGFRTGMQEIAKHFEIPQAVELSISHDTDKVKRNLDRIITDGYQVVLSVHTYKNTEDYLQILDENVPFFQRLGVHHLAHPFHHNKEELDNATQQRFFTITKSNNISVELNERYSRDYNVDFYNNIKSYCKWYPSTDAHDPKNVSIYRKLKKYSIISHEDL